VLGEAGGVDPVLASQQGKRDDRSAAGQALLALRPVFGNAAAELVPEDELLIGSAEGVLRLWKPKEVCRSDK